MGRRKKLINDTNIPQHEIEKLARCFLPDILAFYEVKSRIMRKISMQSLAGG